MFYQKEKSDLVNYLKLAGNCFESLILPMRIDDKMRSEIARFNFNLLSFLKRIPNINIDQARKLIEHS